MLPVMEEPSVQLIAAGPAMQRRLTVAFRAILVIPHSLALIFLGIGGVVVSVIGWWAALFTGRLPGFAFSYLSGLVRWNTRVLGYLYLLTDVYPPFTFDDDAGYPIVIAIPEPGQLNPAAVFFRFILAIWAGLVLWLVSYGASTIAALITWLITLITGKMPNSLHLAYTAALRYHARLSCYGFLLTSTYPWKLFGDRRGTAEPERPSSPPVAWPLVLTQGARNLVTLFIALGLIIGVALNVWPVVRARDTANSAASLNHAISQWDSADSTLTTKIEAWSRAQDDCGQSLTCVTRSDAQAASAMSAFVGQVKAISMPSGAASAVARTVADATMSAADFTTLGQSASIAQYNRAVTSTGLDKDVHALQTDVGDVARTLNNS